MAKDEWDPKLLEEMEKDAPSGLGHGEMENREWAGFLLPGLNYDMQLRAIREEIQNKRKLDNLAKERIENAGRALKNSRGHIWHQFLRETDYVDSCEFHAYQSMAHSASATGMLGPFFESLIKRFCNFGKNNINLENFPLKNQERIERCTLNKFWDFYCNEINKNIIDGSIQIIDSLYLLEENEEEKKKQIKALLHYRNKILHFGMEWPKVEIDKFQHIIIKKEYPPEWFCQATSGGETWMFYLTDHFIEEILETFDLLLENLGRLAWRLTTS